MKFHSFSAKVFKYLTKCDFLCRNWEILKTIITTQPTSGFSFWNIWLGYSNAANAYSIRILSSSSTSSRNLLATNSRASVGQDWNQSIVQQLISEGNIRSRFRKASPTGLMADEKQTWLVSFLQGKEPGSSFQGFWWVRGWFPVATPGM